MLTSFRRNASHFIKKLKIRTMTDCSTVYIFQQPRRIKREVIYRQKKSFLPEIIFSTCPWARPRCNDVKSLITNYLSLRGIGRLPLIVRLPNYRCCSYLWGDEFQDRNAPLPEKTEKKNQLPLSIARYNVIK